MTLNLHVPETEEQLQPRITVAGVGGAGTNAVNNMIQSNLEGVEFLVCNTDAQALQQSLCGNRLQLGRGLTRGLGGGSRPDVGRAAAEEAIDELAEHVHNSDMLFIAAGMGGATGTGAAPVIARSAREKGILTVAVVTKPFHFEGVHRMRVAEQGINELAEEVDTLIIIPNQNLFRVANEKTTFADAFKMADEVLYSGVRGVTDLVVKPGLINLDFADIRSVMTEMGKAMMGTGEAEGENRAIGSAEAAISNPLLDDVSMQGARGVLINITGGPDLTLFEVDEAANRIRDEVDSDANIIFGSTYDPSLEGKMRISVVATGIDSREKQQDAPVTLSLVADNQQQPAQQAQPQQPQPQPQPRPAAAPGYSGGGAATAQARTAAPAYAPPQGQPTSSYPAQTAPAGGYAQGQAQAHAHAHSQAQAQAPAQAPRPGLHASAATVAEAVETTFGTAQRQSAYAAPAEAPEGYDREEHFIAPEPAPSPRRPQGAAAPAGGAPQADPHTGARPTPPQWPAHKQQAPAKGETRRRGGLFSRVTGVFQGGERDKPEPGEASAPNEPRLSPSDARRAEAPTRPAAPRQQEPRQPQQPAAPQGPAAGHGQPQQPRRGDAVSQPRLSGLDPMERQDARAMEEDQLDIPAFLRRQAN